VNLGFSSLVWNPWTSLDTELSTLSFHYVISICRVCLGELERYAIE